MENVFSGSIVLFLMIFSALSFGGTALKIQADQQADARQMDAHLLERRQTEVALLEGRISSDGLRLELDIVNSGATRLADFRAWDVIVQYSDDQISPVYRILYLPYTDQAPLGNQWTISASFATQARTQAEVYEPDIFNPGEVLRLSLLLNSSMLRGSHILAHISTPQGIGTQGQIWRNQLPELASNQTLIVTNSAITPINPSTLIAIDPDGDSAALVYTVITPPAGTLSLPLSFTQADIDNGLLSYQAVALGPDAFTFSLSDGAESSGPFTFSIDVQP